MGGGGCALSQTLSSMEICLFGCCFVEGLFLSPTLVLGLAWDRVMSPPSGSLGTKGSQE